MSEPFSGLLGFVFLAAFLTVAGWELSAVKLLQWEWVALFPGIAGALWVARRTAGSWRKLAQQTIEPFAYWPTLVTGGVLLVAALAYLPGMLDSLTYRLPRTLLWNQAGSVYFIPTVDERLNYLPPVWNFCSMPFIQLGGIRLAWVWSFAGWLACQTMFYAWARDLGQSVLRARQMSFLAMSSTFALLQASGSATDLLVTTFLLLSLYFLTLFETRRQPEHINWSVLALGLAAGVKPHVATLALPFLVWFFLARSQPWRLFRWRWLPLLLPLWVLCSPVPTFWSNLAHYHSPLGPASNKLYQAAGPVWNMALGCLLLGWQALQPCLNPLALYFNVPLEEAVLSSGLHSLEPRLSLRMAPVSIVDGASLGLVTTLLLVAGIVLALRRDRALATSWRGWALLGGGFGFLLAVSQVLPMAVGRSSACFVYLAFPLALVGWSRFSPRAMRCSTALCLAGGLMAVVLNPQRPLWPVSAARSLARNAGWSELDSKLETYQLFSQRNVVGHELLEAVPPEETRVLTLLAEDRPLLPLLWPARHFRLELLDATTTLAQFHCLGARSVLVSGGAQEYFPALCRHLEESGEFELVKSQAYVSSLRRGSEIWSLYRRKPGIAAHAAAVAPSCAHAP